MVVLQQWFWKQKLSVHKRKQLIGANTWTSKQWIENTTFIWIKIIRSLLQCNYLFSLNSIWFITSLTNLSLVLCHFQLSCNNEWVCFLLQNKTRQNDRHMELSCFSLFAEEFVCVAQQHVFLLLFSESWQPPFNPFQSAFGYDFESTAM